MRYLAIFLFLVSLFGCEQSNTERQEKEAVQKKIINTPNKAEAEVSVEPQKQELDVSKKTKSQSDKTYKLPIVLESPKLRICIDQLDDGSFRYRSWNRGESMQAKPSLTLTMKEDSLSQKRQKDVYTFRNGNYAYTVMISRAKQDIYHRPILRVDQGDKNLLYKEISYRLSADNITFPWKELTETGYVPKFYNDSTLIIDQSLYKKLQMEKIYSDDIDPRIEREIVSYLHKDNDIHHVELTIDGADSYFNFLATYTEDWKLIDHLQVGAGDPHHGFWHQNYKITPKKDSKLIVRSSYKLVNEKDELTESDVFELHQNGTFTKQHATTRKHAGTYAYQYGEDGAKGTIYLYPASDSTLLFNLDVNRGAPSYNSGGITGQMHFTSTTEASYFGNEAEYLNCDLRFSFKGDVITVRTEYPANECGFGYGVRADGEYKQTSNKVPEYYYNGEGSKVWFKDLDMDSSYGKPKDVVGDDAITTSPSILLDEAKVFSLSIVKMYFEEDCTQFYNAMNESIYLIDGDGVFAKNRIKRKLCSSIKSAVRNKKKTYEDYTSLYKVELLTPAELTQRFKFALPEYFDEAVGDYFFLGHQLKQGKENSDGFIWDDMFFFMVRKQQQKWTLKALGG